MNVINFLTQHSTAFDVIEHPPAYDAQRMAQAVHTAGKEVAKTVLLRADHGYKYIVALLPAPLHVNLSKVSSSLGGSEIELATEADLSQHCPDCETGALPPFGSQYDMQTIVDDSLTKDEYIVFEGNTHQESIRMKYESFARIEEPLVMSFAE